MKLVADRRYLPTLMGLLSAAQNSIDIFAYSFAMASAAGRVDVKGAPFQIASFLADLKAMHGDQLRIRLYIEGLRDTIDRNRITAEFLKEAGVEVVYGATHVKGLCVDQQAVLMGSTNFTNQSILRNPEANLLIEDKAVAQEFTRYFEYMWNGGVHSGIHLKPPLFADGDFKNKIIDIIDGAKKELHFAIYFFDHPEIEAAFIRAHKRGVRITGLIHRHAKFALSYVYRNYATAKRLQKAGIQHLHFGPLHLFSHAKYLIADTSNIALGTGNWLIEDVEIHPQLYVSTNNKRLAATLLQHLQSQLPALGHESATSPDL